MKNLKTLLEASLLDNAISEASLLDIDDTLESGDTDVLFSLLTSGDEDKVRTARNTIYNDVIDSQKQIRRKSTFKPDTLYIEFFVEPKNDFGLITDDSWGFRIGTCNPNEDDSYLDLIYAFTTIHSNSENGAMTLKPFGPYSTRYLRMDVYLKRPVYLLPEKYKDLFKKLFMYSFKRKRKVYTDEFADRIADTIKKL